jgi:hypothetical protein
MDQISFAAALANVYQALLHAATHCEEVNSATCRLLQTPSTTVLIDEPQFRQQPLQYNPEL